jgi:FdrA protein
MIRDVQLRRGAYQDSVSLMLVSRELSGRGDVATVQVGMATELNLELLEQMGFEVPDDASPNDMVVAIEADDADAVRAATAALDEALSRRPAAGGGLGGDVPAPPTIGAAARRRDAGLALVSTPGRVATIDAADALASGLDVMVFSDNVSVEHEVALKAWAAATGLLVMGPDCGTAVVDGVGLGFANVVRPGPIGIVAASGTGAQQLLALLDAVGLGVKHCLGVGGRDLSSAVGGRSTLAALDRLDADPDVTTIVVVSKPPAEEVADLVARHADSLSKPVVLGYLGPGRPDLTATARLVSEQVGASWTTPARWGRDGAAARHGSLRGLFSGGTLCDEAMLIAVDALGTVTSNIPLAGQPALGHDLAAVGHTFIDFGDDQLTSGRPHPMIDPSLRTERLVRELEADDCAVVLLDVVLGHGAHADPASGLTDVIAGSSTPVVVSLVGTRDDPQGLRAQAERLAEAGAAVHASNAEATREALSLLTTEGSA